MQFQFLYFHNIKRVQILDRKMQFMSHTDRKQHYLHFLLKAKFISVNIGWQS